MNLAVKVEINGCQQCENDLPKGRSKYCSDKCLNQVKAKKRWKKIKDNPEAHEKWKSNRRKWRESNKDLVNANDRDWKKKSQYHKRCWEKLKCNEKELRLHNERRCKWRTTLSNEKLKKMSKKGYEAEKRRKENPEYKRKKMQQGNEWARKTYNNNPERRERVLEYNKIWRNEYFNNPENREARNKKQRERLKNNPQARLKRKISTRKYCLKPEIKIRAKERAGYIKGLIGMSGLEVPPEIIDAKRNLLKIRRLYTEGNKFRTDIVSSRK